MHLLGDEHESISWKTIILTIGLQMCDALFKLSSIILTNISFLESKSYIIIDNIHQVL